MSNVRRNQWGQYLVVPPKGGRELGYRRVTTVAKALDSSDALIPWKATMAIVGLQLRPGLRARWEALLARTSGDPWYHSEASKAEAKALVEECAEAGGSANRAEQGTALHELTELFDRGQLDLTKVDPAMAADVRAYDAAMGAAGLRRLAEWVEVTVVLDEAKVCGTLDRIVVLDRDVEVRFPSGNTWSLDAGTPVVADLKTGSSLDFGQQAIAIQLAAYANADAQYLYGPNGAKSDRRVPLPRIHRGVGVVVHLPAGTARCELHWFDLTAGWEAFSRSNWVFGWRRAKVSSPLVFEQPASPSSPGEEASASLTVASTDLPPEGASPVALIDDAFAGIKDVREVPPVRTFSGRRPPVAAKRPVIDEGGPAAALDLERFKAGFVAVDAAAGAWIRALAEAANTAGHSISITAEPSVRRVLIGRSLVGLAKFNADDDLVLSLLLAVVLGEELQPSIPLGAYLGALTIDQASRLFELVRALHERRLSLVATADRPVTLAGPALAAV